MQTADPPYRRGKGLRAIDKGIARHVRILRKYGVETFESCEGGRGHPFPEPTVRFHGDHAEGFRALAIALQHGLHATQLRRYYTVISGEPTGPYWEMSFSKPRQA